jgi:flagellar motor switch protein FliM
VTGRTAQKSDHTALIDQASIVRPRRAWRHFQFSDLPKVSKREARLVRNLEWLVTGVPLPGAAAEAVQAALTQLLEQELSVTVELVHVVKGAHLRRYIGDPTFLAVLSGQPHKSRGLLEVELNLAHKMVDALLGGSGEMIEMRPLTEIEEGVMTYVVIEALRALAPGLDPSLPLLQIDAVTSVYEESLGLLTANESVLLVQLKTDMGGTLGAIRLMIPESIAELANPPTNAPVRRVRRAHNAEHNVKRIGHIKTLFRAEIGLVELTTGELTMLRERDVLLVDELSFRTDGDEAGTARLMLGLGRGAYAEADVGLVDGRYQATLTRFVLDPRATPFEHVPREAMEGFEGGAERAPDDGDDDGAERSPEDESSDHVEAGGDVENEEAGQGADLINDIPLQIAVELGRISVSAEEIVSLKLGHVFDLGRSPGEPLDLAVNGKVIARGELVEVEGNLGVRIVSLAG